VREALLGAASAAFAERGYAAVALRDVAKSAGTTAAMVHYYFGDKDGLYVALLERALLRLLARVREALAARAAAGPSGAGFTLDLFLDAAMQALGAEPWLPQLVLREVLSDGARFRSRFIERYATPMSQLVRGALRSEIAAGRLRADLDVDLALMSLLGLAAFPYLAEPVISRVLGIDYDAALRARLAAHTKRLFLEGAQP
jgi:AcrR family transcriptional regulator